MKKKKPKKPQRIVHHMQYGHTACMKGTLPKDWPPNEFWEGTWEHVNCPDCLKGKDPIDTFTIAADGKSITCLRCKMRSYNPNDVENHYCGMCGVCHDDLWPPARAWWIAHPDPPREPRPARAFIR